MYEVSVIIILSAFIQKYYSNTFDYW